MVSQSFESPETIQRFKELFHHFNEPQWKFGKRFDLDQSYLSTVLNGRKKISGTVVKAMAKSNIDIRWLLTGKGEMFAMHHNESHHEYNQKRVVNSEALELKNMLIQSYKEQVDFLNDALERNEEIIKTLADKH